MAEETHEKNHNFSSAKNVTIEVDRKIHRFPPCFWVYNSISAPYCGWLRNPASPKGWLTVDTL
jgi:hypothetical protein